ncbi:RNA 2',3'-cyclic phosphodiesterase [Aliiroseovarius sp.]|uniref:RNA 2',3'-cyclic phosphodiesterase n=1 Tax=Aliiroseovarius sp. TaxID=1872442 RepID=UPI00262134C3|nr:RNA 2',3'-cyclic phosphodiesterase [Aliiroseovarius sp.]
MVCVRCFLALPLPEATRETLADLAHALPMGRPVPEENLHLTLAFLDEVTHDDLERLHEGLEAMCAPPVTLTLSGLELFGGKSPALMAILASGADALQGKLVRAAGQAGIPLPRRRFRGHVTLTRFPRRMEPGQLDKLGLFLQSEAATRLPPFEVGHFALYASHLHPEGARHEVLAQYPLEG